MRTFLTTAVECGLLRDLDLHFARRLETIAGAEDPLLLLGAALASQGVGRGDVCFRLDDCAASPLFQSDLGRALVRRRGIRPPHPARWAESLRRSPVVGAPGERAPLILDVAGRLYLGRYWQFEHDLTQALAARTGAWTPGIDRRRLAAGLDRLFATASSRQDTLLPPGGGGVGGEGGEGEGSQDTTDWQRVAAAMAVLRPFAVISGGPGTGKTRTVTSILALLVEQHLGWDAQPARRSKRPDAASQLTLALDPPPLPGGPPALRIGLAAPTGKAAARLTESIRLAKSQLPLAPEIAARIPEEALTLHRLLGFRPGRANPRHGPDDPLHLDLLVVDEASMVDLPLMARLFAALPARARLILLGDKDQLASVEAGMVLGDICGRGAETVYSPELAGVLADLAGPVQVAAARSGPAIGDHLAVLRKSWRFDAGSGIGALARAVNAGEPEQALAVLADPACDDVELIAPGPEVLAGLIAERIVPVYRKVLAAATPAEALSALESVRLLCAVREGQQGVIAVNRLIEEALAAAGLITRNGELYAGRPVMVIANDHAQRLYNGDVGLILPDPASGGALRAFFATAEGIRRILPSRLPPHETVYAMTVHKSQGSEFASVVLVLPEGESRVVTRELVYTGLTRAKQRVAILADAPRLRESILARVVRATGLHDALWGDA